MPLFQYIGWHSARRKWLRCLINRSFATTVSQLKICDFSGETFKGFLRVQRRQNCSPAVSFAKFVMTLYLLRVRLQTFLSIPMTQKCQILNYDTLVANERNVHERGDCQKNNVLYFKSLVSAISDS
jgi:hypothetical protein